MHSYSKNKIMPYKPKLIKGIIMDIENYPRFLPWCSSATILSREEEYLLAKLDIRFKGFFESYVSKVLCTDIGKNYQIDVLSVSGPFKYLRNIWEIKNINNISEVKFSIDFEFKSRILDGAIGMIFTSATEKMVVAFETRAQKLSEQSKRSVDLKQIYL